MQKLLLIDGNAIMHRAYHALPPLTAPDGTIINAVYGFLSMMFTVVTDLQPKYLIVSFDISKPTYRQSLFAGYHQHRPSMADDMVPQFAIIHEILQRMKIQIYELEGFEADDVIGTIANQVKQLSVFSNQLSANRRLITDNRIETIILTGDRDLLQLVNDTTKVLMPVVGVKQTVLMDEAKVEEKYGVKSSQFIDYKALIGDQSDGYPGVTGIGPKTASSLLQKYGTFEALYERIGELPEKYATKLAIDAEQAAMAKKLATIITDAPITSDITKCQWRDMSVKGAYEVFEKFGFDSLKKRFTPLLKTVEDAQKGQQMELL